MARSPDGHRPRCKECRRTTSREYYEENAEATKERVKVWRGENPEQSRANSREWRKRNWKEKSAADRQYYLAHREDILAYNKTPERRAAHRANARNQKAKRRAAMGATIDPMTAEQWETLKESYSGLCVYCHGRDGLTMDHIVPLNLGGDHVATNIVPACGRCNRIKSDRPLLVFLAERMAEA